MSIVRRGLDIPWSYVPVGALLLFHTEGRHNPMGIRLFLGIDAAGCPWSLRHSDASAAHLTQLASESNYTMLAPPADEP